MLSSLASRKVHYHSHNHSQLPAFEILSDPAKRRLYVSVDEFDDSVPSVTKENKDNFYKVFSPVVLSNSRSGFEFLWLK